MTTASVFGGIVESISARGFGEDSVLCYKYALGYHHRCYVCTMASASYTGLTWLTAFRSEATSSTVGR
jgi:hypothetical protein